MTKKSILIFLGMFLLVALPIVSAEKITYSEDDLKVTLSDTVLFGLIKTSDFGTSELKSHKSIEEIIKFNKGKHVTMYYDFDFNEIYGDGLGEVIFIDKNSGKEIEKDYEYVYWSQINETSGEWLPYNSKDIPEGKIRIGIKTEVKEGDWIDGIWEIGGKKISKHAQWSFQSASSDTTETTYYSFGGVSIGSAASNRQVIVGIKGTTSSAYGSAQGGSVVNVTIGGVSATQVIANYSSDSGSPVETAEIWWADVPTGTTATITVGWNGTMARMGLGTWTAYGLSAINSTDSRTKAANLSGVVDVPSGAVVIGVLGANSGSAVTWGGLTEDYDAAIVGNDWQSGASSNFSSEIINYSVSASAGLFQNSVLVVASFGESAVVLNPYLVSPDNASTITQNQVDLVANVQSQVPSIGVANVSLCLNGNCSYDFNDSEYQGDYIFSYNLTEGKYNWTIFAYGNDSIQYNATNGTLFFTVDLFEPTITLIDPLNNTSSNRANWSLATNITPNNYTLINSTTYVWFQNGTLFNSILNTSIAGTSEVLVNDTFTELPFGFNYYWNTEVFFQNNLPEIFSNFSSENYSFTRLPFEVTNESYNFTSYETESQTFQINLSTVSNILSTSISLNYDEERYFTETNCVDGTCELMQTIDIPLVDSGENENKTFFWELTLFTIENDVFQFNTTSHQQNVSRIHLEFEDSTYVNRSLNFTTWRESNRTILNPMSFKATFDSWLGSGSVKRNSTFENLSSFSGIQLAIDPADRTFYTNAIIEYDAVGNFLGIFTPRNYFFQNETLTTSVQNISLFLLESADSTSFIQRVVDTSQIAQVGVLVLQQKYYPETNEYETVAISMTDSNGEGVGFYEIEVSEYRHIIISNGTILKITEKGKVVPQTAPYTLIFTLGEDVESPWTSFEGIENIISSLTFNQTTSIVTYEWIDSTGTITLVNLTVDQVYGNQSDVTICSETSLLTSGILTCNVSGYEGNFNAKGYITRTTTLIDKIVVFTISEIKDLLAIPSLGLFIILLIGVIGMSLAYPPAGVILIGVFLGLAQLIGITAISWIFVWAIILVGVWILIETT